MNGLSSSSVLASLALLLVAPDALAFSVQLNGGQTPVRWRESHVTYYVQYAGSDDLDPETSVEIIRKAFASWEEVGCADLTFEELGDVPNPKAVTLTSYSANGKTELAWIEDDDWTLGQFTLGVTTPLVGQDGFLYEADIAFNGYLVKWSATGSSGTDLESVAVHEIGHLFGLQHNLGPFSWQQPPTMAPSIANKNKSRTLEDDDVMGVCFLYPVTGTWTCESDDECPMILDKRFNDKGEDEEYYAGKLLCSAETGTCADIDLYKEGIAGLGEECEHEANCKDNLYCQPWQESAVCTGYCDVAQSACPDGFDCEPFENYPAWGACLPSDGEIVKPGEGPAGCTSADQCTDGRLCLPTPREDDGERRVCSELCTAGDDSTCAEGEICWSWGQDNGGCFAPEELPGYEPPEAEPEPEPEPEVEPDAGPTEPEIGAGEDAGPQIDSGGAPGVDDDEAIFANAAKATGGPGCSGAGALPTPLGALLGAALALLALSIRRRMRV